MADEVSAPAAPTAAPETVDTNPPAAAVDVPMLGNDASTEEAKPDTVTDAKPDTNGDVAAVPSSDPPADADTSKGDITMNEVDTAAADAGDDAGAADAAPVTPAPASAKKANGGSSKKRSSGVPEHKSKKLNRKKSKAQLNLTAQGGDYFLARMKGHPWWPAIVCDEEMLPQVLLTSRPVTAALADGSFKKPEYADGGKRAGERTFPIMFLCTNEFAWMPNTDLQPLTPDACKDVPEKGKGKALLEAYKIAAEGYDLTHFKEILAEHQEQLAEDKQRQKEREAKKAAKSKRKSGASVAAGNDDEDEMDVDDEEVEEKPKSKKRKKAAETDGEDDEKPAKTPKTGTKLKLTTPKTPVTESAGKKKAAKPKAPAKKANAKTSGSDDEMIDTPMVEEKPLSPAELKEKKEKEIRYYRHKLQRGFLSRDTIPTDEDTKSMSSYLGKLETYPDLEASIIRATKIHKVLKAMIRLPSIPKDDQYSFKKRSVDLLALWNKVLAEDPTGAGEKDDDAKGDEPKAEEPKADKAEDEPAKPETNGVKEAADTEKPVAEEKPAEEKPAEAELAKVDVPAAEEKPVEDVKPTEPVAAEPEAPKTETSAPAAAEAVEATA